MNDSDHDSDHDSEATKIDHDKDEENYLKRDEAWEGTLKLFSVREMNDGEVPFLLFPLRFFSYSLRFSDHPAHIWNENYFYPRYVLHRLALLKVSILDSSAVHISYKQCKMRCFSEFSHSEHIDPRVANAASFLNPSIVTLDGQRIITTMKEPNHSPSSSSLPSLSSEPSTPLSNYRRRFLDYNGLQSRRLIVGLSRAPWSIIPGPTITLTEKEERMLQSNDKNQDGKEDHSLNYLDSAPFPVFSAIDNSNPSKGSSQSSTGTTIIHNSPSKEIANEPPASSSSSPISRFYFSSSLDSINNECLITIGLSYETEGCYNLSYSIWNLLMNRGHHYGYYKIGVRYLYGWNIRRCIDTAIYLFECSALASTSITPGLVYFLHTRHINLLCSDAGCVWPRMSVPCALMLEYLVSEMIKVASLSGNQNSPLPGPLKIKSLGEVCRIPPPSDLFDADVLCLLMYLRFWKYAPASLLEVGDLERQLPAIEGWKQLSSAPRSHPISALFLATNVYGDSYQRYYNVQNCIHYYKQASDGGLVEACTQLGRLYEVGYLDEVCSDIFKRKNKVEFPIDLQQSCHYYQLALQRGDIDSEEYLKRVQEQRPA